jgi:hypothetical protein
MQRIIDAEKSALFDVLAYLAYAVRYRPGGGGLWSAYQRKAGVAFMDGVSSFTAPFGYRESRGFTPSISCF